VERGLERVLAIWTAGIDGDALLVAHRGVIRAIVRKLTNQQPVVELGSIQILEFDDGWRVVALDSCEHLA
jgi:broad specificity phosphatase PhoE